MALIISLLFLVKAKVSQDCFIIMQNFLSSYHYHQCAIKFIISWNENDFFESIIAVSSDKYAVIFWAWSMYYILKCFFILDGLNVLWFNFILGLNFIFFCFKPVIIHNTQLLTKENKIQTKDKLSMNHHKYMHTCIINHYTYTFPQVDSVAPA